MGPICWQAEVIGSGKLALKHCQHTNRSESTKAMNGLVVIYKIKEHWTANYRNIQCVPSIQSISRLPSPPWIRMTPWLPCRAAIGWYGNAHGNRLSCGGPLSIDCVLPAFSGKLKSGPGPNSGTLHKWKPMRHAQTPPRYSCLERLGMAHREIRSESVHGSLTNTCSHTHAIPARRNLTNCEMVDPNRDKLVRLHWMACWTNSYAASVLCKQRHPRKCMTRECSLAFEHMGWRKWMAAGGCICCTKGIEGWGGWYEPYPKSPHHDVAGDRQKQTHILQPFGYRKASFWLNRCSSFGSDAC